MEGLAFVLALAPLAAWPAADPQLPPEALADPSLMPDDPEYAPREDLVSGCAGQHGLYSFTPACTPAIAREERARALGPGIRADRAWLWTPGRPDVTIAIADSGADWSDPDLIARWRLSAGELPAPRTSTSAGVHDRNGDGAFTVLDYTTATGTVAPVIDTVADLELLARSDRGDANNNGYLDPQDLILIHSDGADGDANGYVDDIAGWDFAGGDNDAGDPGGGPGPALARAAAATADNGVGGAGACPRCTALPLRVSTRGLAGGNELALAIIYAADSGADVLATSVAAAGGTTLIERAVAHAAASDLLIVAGAGNAASTRREVLWDPGAVVIIGSIGYDRARPREATTALSPDPCGGFGAQLAVVAPGRCDVTAPGLAAGAAGLLFSAARGIPERNVAALVPPLTAAEARRIVLSAATPLGGFGERTGHGRVDARAMVDAVIQRRVPVEARFAAPGWFSIVDPTPGAAFEVTARLHNRRDRRATWVLDYALGFAPADTAFAPIGSGSVEAGELAEVTGAVPAGDLFADATATPAADVQFAVTLRLTTRAGEGAEVARAEERRVIFAHRDLDLLPGFPRTLDSGVIGSARLRDLDGDGSAEIVVASEGGRVHAIDAKGRDLPGWPAAMPPWDELDLSVPGNHAGAPAFSSGAVARDVLESVLATVSLSALSPSAAGESVVAFGAGGSVVMFARNGERAAASMRLPITPEAPLDAPPILYDLDGDGALEIVIAVEQALYAFTAAGDAVAGFPVMLPERIGPPAAGDVDGDGRPDLVLAGEDAIHIVHGDGNTHAGGAFHASSPIMLPPRAPGVSDARGLETLAAPAPVLADVDGDGAAELVVAARGRPLLTFEASGGPPRLEVASARAAIGGRSTAAREGPAIVAAGTPAALADLDGDGVLDAVAAAAGATTLGALEPGARAERLHGAWSLAGGAFVPGAPRPSGLSSLGGPAIADVDGDGRPEVITAGADGTLEAFSADGTRPRRWPKLTGGFVLGAPAIGDLDRDGRLDVVAVTRDGRVFAWRGRAEDRAAAWPSYRHDDRATGNLATPTFAASLDHLGAGCTCDTAHRGSGAEVLLLLFAIACRFAHHRRCARR